LKKIQAYRKSVEIPAIPLSRLVGNQPGEYFTYLGKAIKLNGDFGISQWIVFTEALDVSSEQVHVSKLSFLKTHLIVCTDNNTFICK
jgi:hypothetical protein